MGKAWTKRLEERQKPRERGEYQRDGEKKSSHAQEWIECRPETVTIIAENRPKRRGLRGGLDSENIFGNGTTGLERVTSRRDKGTF